MARPPRVAGSQSPHRPDSGTELTDGAVAPQAVPQQLDATAALPKTPTLGLDAAAQAPQALSKESSTTDGGSASTRKLTSTKVNPTGQTSRLDKDRADQVLLTELSSVFDAHEIKIIGLVGVLTGYISLFIIDVLRITSVVLGSAFVCGLVFLLLIRHPSRRLLSPDWWLRTLIAVILSALITAPQISSSMTAEMAKLGIYRVETRDADIARARKPEASSPVLVQPPNQVLR